MMMVHPFGTFLSPKSPFFRTPPHSFKTSVLSKDQYTHWERDTEPHYELEVNKSKWCRSPWKFFSKGLCNNQLLLKSCIFPPRKYWRKACMWGLKYPWDLQFGNNSQLYLTHHHHLTRFPGSTILAKAILCLRKKWRVTRARWGKLNFCNEEIDKKKLVQMSMAITTTAHRCLTNPNISSVNEFSLICHIISGGIDGQWQKVSSDRGPWQGGQGDRQEHHCTWSIVFTSIGTNFVINVIIISVKIIMILITDERFQSLSLESWLWLS